MAVPSKKRKPDALFASQMWLQIYKIVFDGLDGHPNREQLAAYAANALIKEVDLGYAA